MTYITVMQSPMYHQITLEELLFSPSIPNPLITKNESNTRTYLVEGEVSERLLRTVHVDGLITRLHKFNEMTAALREQDRRSLYNSFKIPKRTGGMRRIDAPNDDLMNALRVLKTIFERDFKALYHTSAFAYVRNRSTIDAVKRHQTNRSRWFLKMDLHDFFGSTTPEFLMRMLSMVFPFSEVVKRDDGRQELHTALSLAFLNGGLPQGTPISPLLTNIMMIPIDYKLSNTLNNLDGTKFVYTRYADDFIISSRKFFSKDRIQALVVDTLHEFGAPFSINREKTRYGSSAGSNWNLGVMLNKDNEITVGSQRKRQFKTALFNYIKDKEAGVRWSAEDLYTIQGQYSYYHMVEPKAFEDIVATLNKKHRVNVLQSIKNDLSV